MRVVDWEDSYALAANVAANSPQIAGEFSDGLGDVLDQIGRDCSDLVTPLQMDALDPRPPKKQTEVKGEVEISPELHERQDYIVFVVDNEFDWQVICDRFGITTVTNPKMKSVVASASMTSISMSRTPGWVPTGVTAARSKICVSRSRRSAFSVSDMIGFREFVPHILWRLRRPYGAVVVAGDTLYTGTDNKLVAIDLQTQQKLWEFETEDSVMSSPAVADTTVYIGSEDGRLYAVDTATGEKLWDILTGGKITSSPAVVDGTVYVGSHDGKLYAIR